MSSPRGMRSSIEREVKFTAPPSFRMPSLEGVAEGVTASSIPSVRLATTYLDTDDLRLARWGVSLRHRVGEGWTVKLPAEQDVSLLARMEHTFAGNGDRPPAEAVNLVGAFVRTADLRPQASLKTLRGRVELRDGDGNLVVDVVDDDVSVLEGTRTAMRFREVEVEISEDTRAHLLDEVVDRMRQAGASRPDPTPKYLRALGQRAPDTPEVQIVKIGSKATAGEVIRRALALSVVRLIEHDPVVRLDENSEGVHQTRVATRRLRSDLRTFRSLLDPAWTKALRDELGWLAELLGAVRDGDVLLERLRRREGELPDLNDLHFGGVLGSVEAMRDEAQLALIAILRSERYLTLLDSLVGGANDPPLLREANVRAADILPGLVRRPWKSLAKAVKSLPDAPTDVELHEVRIKAKRLRYAAEATAPVGGRKARKLAGKAADLQDVLGDLNDAVFAERWLRETGSETDSAPEAFAVGELAGLEWAAADRCRARWKRVWRKLSAPKLRRWI
jgi:CHAD domain-containing protein